MQPGANDFYEHPVFDPFSLRIMTPMIKAFEKSIKQWIWTGLPGGIVVGGSRMGKTVAAETIMGNISDRKRNKLPAKFISIPQRDSHTVKSVFNEIARTFDPKVNISKTSDQLSNLVLYALSDLACTTSSRAVMLFIDETQRLNPLQLQVFAELYDKLRIADIRLCVIFLANTDESVDLIEQMKLQKHRHLYGRFFTRLHTFRGIYSEKCVKAILTLFDKTRYPSKSGMFYTEYFTPQAFKKGFRFTELSPIIWQTFRERFKNTGSLRDWPAQYFFNSMCILLADYIFKMSIHDINEDVIEAAIEASNIIPDIVAVS